MTLRVLEAKRNRRGMFQLQLRRCSPPVISISLSATWYVCMCVCVCALVLMREQTESSSEEGMPPMTLALLYQWWFSGGAQLVGLSHE